VDRVPDSRVHADKTTAMATNGADPHRMIVRLRAMPNVPALGAIITRRLVLRSIGFPALFSVRPRADGRNRSLLFLWNSARVEPYAANSALNTMT
jgi:hypothetical protein